MSVFPEEELVTPVLEKPEDGEEDETTRKDSKQTYVQHDLRSLDPVRVHKDYQRWESNDGEYVADIESGLHGLCLLAHEWAGQLQGVVPERHAG